MPDDYRSPLLMAARRVLLLSAAVVFVYVGGSDLNNSPPEVWLLRGGALVLLALVGISYMFSPAVAFFLTIAGCLGLAVTWPLTDWPPLSSFGPYAFVPLVAAILFLCSLPGIATVKNRAGRAG